jgi:hypothetical protein
VTRKVVAAVGAVVVIGVAMPAPAQAEQPTPVPPVILPATVDRAAFYEPQTICDPTPRRGVLALRDLLIATYGPATTYMSRACTSSTSEHFDGRALDWMRNSRVAAQKAQADAFVAWLLAADEHGTPQAMARRLGVQYVIWNNQMIRMYDPDRGWTDYNGCMAKSRAGTGMDTSCHRNHVHLSLSWDGAAGQTSFWTGVAQTLDSCSPGRTRATGGAGTPRVIDPAATTGLVSVPPRRILDSAAGSGSGLNARCRLRAGRSLYPTARLEHLLPSGARSAAVRITSTSNAPARLSVWSSGVSQPAGQVSTPMGTTTATLLVPIASDGTVGLATSLGSARLRAWVVGYVEGPVGPEPGAPRKIARPTAPRKVKAYSADGAVSTRWWKPRFDGGSAIGGYRVQALMSEKKGAAVAGECTAPPTSRRCTIRGLALGQTYWMSVSVGNAAGRAWAKRVSVAVR